MQYHLLKYVCFNFVLTVVLKRKNFDSYKNSVSSFPQTMSSDVDDGLQDEKEDLLVALQDINEHAPIKEEHQRNWHQSIERLRQADQD